MNQERSKFMSRERRVGLDGSVEMVAFSKPDFSDLARRQQDRFRRVTKYVKRVTIDGVQIEPITDIRAGPSNVVSLFQPGKMKVRPAEVPSKREIAEFLRGGHK